MRYIEKGVIRIFQVYEHCFNCCQYVCNYSCCFLFCITVDYVGICNWKLLTG